MADDGLQIVEMRLPIERGPGTVGGRDDAGRIARPPARELDLEVDARYALHGLDYVEHGKATAISAIKRRRGAAAAQIRERIGMRGDEIGHVNIITDASAVCSWIIGAEDIHFRP